MKNSEMNLLVKGNFKQTAECEGFVEIRLKKLQSLVQDLEVTNEEIHSQSREWKPTRSRTHILFTIISNRSIVV